MTMKFEKKIVSVSVVSKEEHEGKIDLVPVPKVQQLNEQLKRPDVLHGKTYKIKPPVCDSALYITLNDIVLNPGSSHETRRPFEIFIASKNMAEYQWVAAFTRVASAVFRKGGDIIFIVEELKSVQDPNGGYYSKRGRMSSVVAEIGCVIEQHFKDIGLIKSDDLLPAVVALREEAKVSGAMEHAADCVDCGGLKCVVTMDGCPVCVVCGSSKCG